METIDLGFYQLQWIDIVDWLLVGIIAYQIFKLLRGSLAFNIFIGLITIYLLWLLVRALKLELMAGIIGEFTKVGMLAVLIVFQQEIRRFLLLIGRNTVTGQNYTFENFIPRRWRWQKDASLNIDVIVDTAKSLSEKKVGATMVLAKTPELKLITATGVATDAIISKRMLETIFNKNGPLHDGAIVIAANRIKAAACILPITEKSDFNQKIGLRHRSAIGMSEQSDALVLVISEETGQLAVAQEGNLQHNLTPFELKGLLQKEFGPHAHELEKSATEQQS